LHYDLWFDSFTPPFGVSLIPLIASKPVIGVIHMLPGRDMWRKYRIPFHWIERIGLRQYRQLIVLTEVARDEIKAYCPETTITVIPNGVSFPTLPAESRKSHILFLGRIEIDQKGIDLLLSAYDAIADQCRYPLVVAGRGIASDEAELYERISVMKHADHVSTPGRVEGKAKDELLAEAALVVVPSRFETFSITALEALSYGVPVVSFDIQGLSTIPSKYVWKAESFNVMSLAEKMIEALRADFPPQYFREAVRPYTWETVGKQYRSVITNTL
jgi:glycosyltransferase involved in cell wall biosynthesis